MDKMFEMISVVLLYLFRLCLCSGPEVVYVVNLDSQMEVCDDESALYVDVSNVNVERYNETIAYMYGDIDFLQDVGPDIMVELILMKEASGQYEIMFAHEICDLCGELQKGIDSDYHRYMKYFGIPDSCPFETGEYPIKEFIVDTDDLPLNSNTCGRYQAQLKLYKNSPKDCKSDMEFLFCLTLNLVIDID